jgi:predicted ester cyclase
MKIMFIAVIVCVFTATNTSAQSNNSSFTTYNLNTNSSKAKEERKKQTNSVTQNSDELKEERNKEIILNSYKAYEANNLDASFKEWDKDVKIYRISNPDSPIGLDSFVANEKKSYAEIKAAFPDIKQHLLAVVSDGDYVITWVQYTGTSKANFKEYKTTGKSFKYDDAEIFKFNQSGKVTEYHHVHSSREIGLQVGHLKLIKAE